MSTPLQLTILNYKQGAYIVVEGKANADTFFIIRSGKVLISKEVEVVAEEGGNVLGPGDFFGVVSTMSGHSHIETARALSEVSVISVARDNYGMLIEKNAPVAMKIIESFSKRMRYLDEALARLTQKTTHAEADISHLFYVGEYYARHNQYNQAYYAYHQYLKFNPQGEHVLLTKTRMAKIKPYAKPVYLDPPEDEFTRTYPKNTMIFSETMPGKELYIIQKGQVKITKIVNDNEVMLAMLKPGDIFGEMSLIENKPRSASAIAHEDSVMLAVNRENFARMVTTQPQIISRLTTLLAERIWFIYKQLANTLLTDNLGKLYDGLMIQLEKMRTPIRPNEAFTFEFGPKELINMVGLSMADGQVAMNDMLKNSKIRQNGSKLHTTDLEEVFKQAQYFRKMQKISKARQDAKH